MFSRKRHARRTKAQFSTATAEVLEQRRMLTAGTSDGLENTVLLAENIGGSFGRLAQVTDFKGDMGFDGTPGNGGGLHVSGLGNGGGIFNNGGTINVRAGGGIE